MDLGLIFKIMAGVSISWDCSTGSVCRAGWDRKQFEKDAAQLNPLDFAIVCVSPATLRNGKCKPFTCTALCFKLSKGYRPNQHGKTTVNVY